MRPRSLRALLTVPLIIAAILLGAATFWAIDYQISARLQSEFDAALLARADALRNLVQFEEADPEEGEPEPYLEFDFEPDAMPGYGEEREPDEVDFGDDDAEDDEDEAEPEPAYFQLWADREPLARSPSLGDHELPLEPVSSAGPVARNVILPDREPGRLLTVRFQPHLDEEWGEMPEQRLANLRRRYPGLHYPTVTLAVAVSRDDLDDTLAFIQWVLAAGLLGLTVVIAGLATVVASRGLRPLERLVSQLAQIDSRHLDGRTDEAGLPTELVPVATTINALLDRLEDAFEKERLFSRNVAHELRTPIAELRSLGEVGTRWPDDPEANAAFFQDISRAANRMDLMVSNLLMMARQENGHGTTAEPVDLVDALERGCRRFESEYEDQDLEIAVHAPEKLEVEADRVYLDIMISNLVSNAIHHGGEGKPISVAACAKNGEAAFAVENDANGLSEADLPHLFDRFWRKDQARTAGRHVGLGLPLVRTLVESCGWTVDVKLTGEHRFRVEISGIPKL